LTSIWLLTSTNTVMSALPRPPTEDPGYVPQKWVHGIKHPRTLSSGSLSHPPFHPPTTTTMNNFGVIEIASTTTKTTPGWAYVPDTGPTPPQALQPPTNRKRAARNQPALSLSDLSAREETRVRKELEALDRDSHRDVNIPIPAKPGGGRRTSPTTTITITTPNW